MPLSVRPLVSTATLSCTKEYLAKEIKPRLSDAKPCEYLVLNDNGQLEWIAHPKIKLRILDGKGREYYVDFGVRKK